MAVKPPAPAASVVVVATRAASRARPPLRPSVEPALKPYQPTHRMKTPSTPSGSECPGIGATPPEAVNRPRRAPTTMAPTRAAQPPTEWTTVDPAKSTTPMPFIGSSVNALRKPLPSQIQCVTIGYTMPVISAE